MYSTLFSAAPMSSIHSRGGQIFGKANGSFVVERFKFSSPYLVEFFSRKGKWLGYKSFLEATRQWVFLSRLLEWSIISIRCGWAVFMDKTPPNKDRRRQSILITRQFRRWITHSLLRWGSKCKIFKRLQEASASGKMYPRLTPQRSL